MTRIVFAAGLLVVSLLAAGSALAQKPVVLARRDATVTLEPYAPNIIRVTMSLKKDAALASPGYGISGKPSTEGWNYEHTDKLDTYHSAQLFVLLQRVERARVGGVSPRRRSCRTGMSRFTARAPPPAAS